MTAPGLSGRRAVVTGAASGIGAAVAARLAGLGAHVVVCDIDAEGAARTAEQIGGEALAIDLSRTAELAEREFDADILVNNAGVQHVAPVERFDPGRFAFMLRLMLEAPFLLSRAVLPGMYERGWGRIVHIASVHGLRASAYKSAYVSAKHGLLGLSKVIALEGAASGVTSNCVCPGYVRTPLVENQLADQAAVHQLSTGEVLSEVLLARSAVKRLIEPDEVAGAVAYLCSPEATSITGAELVLDGGWSAS
ncbi:3-hydroxybutyrate dehydrogenase [Amycolatopsis bartoniae]|uniref:3-hydroxybutyrate dehydrogenase n=1 Tax=Amycolatopsis bartoniae TaxID=941986 RepID=A0A8H9J0F1_9PSEU|nr:3-hydroxybutyrate dehydrogenase [Amycolatopsis bartoniae]MBB2939857.1 3-hydroxybutyrate dehydrogenase [Amycolatopsis bartoniae]TVT07443.1 3-hydroxybutyrate dehydrogenase [Amycolatopsis bartoniae]GHF54987.1 3-hydroxybutyrate dehydrogenase [Amycolatopsis bartoniae]